MSVKKPLYSIKLEQRINAGLLKFPHKFHEVSAFLSPDDFGDPSNVNSTIYRALGAMISEGVAVDYVLVTRRLLDLNIRFEGGINIGEYIQSLSMQTIKEEAVNDIAKQIKKLSIRRSIIENAKKIEETMVNLGEDASFDEIVSSADKIYNNQVSSYCNQDSGPVNLFETMEQEIESLAENPPEEVGFMLPEFPRTNQMFGSLFKGGNITVVCSRFGVGKTSLCLDLSTKVAAHYNVPILHCDHGEMSAEELRNRLCAAISGVPLHMIEKGTWRKNKDTLDRVRAIWPRVKNYKFYYYNTGGMQYPEIINLARRWYYSNVGRGNEMIWSYDYIKAMAAKGGDLFWMSVGEMLEAMKTFIQKEIVYENKPKISLFTSVQSNRKGISDGKDSSELEAMEDSVGLSDFIGQLASHLFFFRRKTTDEIMSEGDKWGTHKLMPVKIRHMGEDPKRFLNLIKNPVNNKLERNYINLQIDNFRVSEKGDLLDRLNSLNVHGASPIQDGAPFT